MFYIFLLFKRKLILTFQDIILDISCEILLSKKTGVTLQLTGFQKISRVIAILLGTSIRTLFFVITKTAKYFFKDIENTIEDSLCRKLFKREHELKEKLEILRHRYDLACRFVDQVNDSFGLILLLNLSWFFYRSLSTFSELLVAYAYIVIMGLRFDFWNMSWAIKLIEMNYLNNKTGNSLKYGSSTVSLSTLLQRHYSLENSCYIIFFYSFLFFITIWSRFLIIVVPSINLHKQVINYIFVLFQPPFSNKNSIIKKIIGTSKVDHLFDSLRRIKNINNKQLLLQVTHLCRRHAKDENIPHN